MSFEPCSQKKVENASQGPSMVILRLSRNLDCNPKSSYFHIHFVLSSLYMYARPLHPNSIILYGNMNPKLLLCLQYRRGGLSCWSCWTKSICLWYHSMLKSKSVCLVLPTLSQTSFTLKTILSRCSSAVEGVLNSDNNSYTMCVPVDIAMIIVWWHWL